jgi:hypothetical protein
MKTLTRKAINFHPYIPSGIIILCIFLSQCTTPVKEKDISGTDINTTHLDGLYEEKIVAGDTVGIIHLYSEFPDYKHVGDGDEGIACVDDASRAAIFYLRQYDVTKDPEHLRKGKMLVKFMLAMQAPNGYYYNFIWPDGRIHTDGITSKPEPNFWSWRTLWAFGEVIHIMDNTDPLVSKMNQQRDLLVRNILAEPSFWSQGTDTTMGWTFPTWLPKYSGTDQTAIILIGLSHLIQQTTPDQMSSMDSVVLLMEHFGDGLCMMQHEQPGALQDGAFLSWENVWHAYANIQSYAFLMAGEAIDNPHFTAHALYEIDHFYPTVLSTGGLNHFSIRVDSGKVSVYDQASFPQIAYGRRPMVWAALKAYELTQDQKYLSLATELAAWFSGKNPANVPMYDSATGRGFDGITSADQINKNAGAESTIEALLALQAMEKYNR